LLFSFQTVVLHKFWGELLAAALRYRFWANFTDAKNL
jgi:hypothetical protein